MAKFSYQARNENQELVKGILEAPTASQAQQFLTDKSFQVLSIKKHREMWKLEDFLSRFETVKPADFNFFVRQLATLLKAGVPMLACLQSLQEEMQDKVLRKALEGVYQEVEGGSSFSDAISGYPRVFNKLFLSTVRAGEAIGELDTALLRLADLFEKDYQTQTKIKSALRYPLFVILIMIGAFILTIVFIVPKFKDLFAGFGADLPIPTRILLGLSYVFQNFWLLVLLVVLGAAVGIYYHHRTHAGRRFWDRLLLNSWLVGVFLKQAIYSRFCRMLGLMLKSGVNILPALELVSEIAGNSIVSDSILRIKEGISQGSTMSSLMRKEKLFPVLVIQMVKAGEASGRIDELLIQASEHYDTELDRLTKNIESMIEPLFILMLGTFIAILALGIFLPMWNLYGLIGAQA
jgi:MSHA biogenesis protein MshG